MDQEELEVVEIDCYSGKSFLVHFSDNTYATVSARELATCFPERSRIPSLKTNSLLLIRGARFSTHTASPLDPCFCGSAYEHFRYAKIVTTDKRMYRIRSCNVRRRLEKVASDS
jgi:hypothetical protein